MRVGKGVGVETNVSTKRVATAVLSLIEMKLLVITWRGLKGWVTITTDQLIIRVVLANSESAQPMRRNDES